MGITANSSLSTTPIRFDDAPARNVFKYLEMYLYCHKLGSLAYISAAGSMGPCLLLFMQLLFLSQTLSVKNAVRKRILI